MKNFHKFHIVDLSPWPILSALASLMLTSSLIIWFHQNNPAPLLTSITMASLISAIWWRDVIRESTFQGLHTPQVLTGLKIGMILFIISEVMFFLSFFWTFLHSSLSPSIEIGMSWPPKSISPFNPLEVPLLNTAILLSSGVSITWCHYSLMNSNKNQAFNSLLITLMLGVLFTMAQLFEYLSAPFSMPDSIFGSTFFLMTGFHGLHVIIGSIFLATSLARLKAKQFSHSHHLGFELSAWYWHFVDVVWLFLYSLIYWWGS